MEVSHDKLLSLKLGQKLYTDGMPRRFGLHNCKLAGSLMIESFFSALAGENDKSSQDVQLYQQIMGSLLYLALRTSMDILAPVLILARFHKHPTAYCHRALRRVLHYLRGTHNQGLLFQSGPVDMNWYVNADYRKR